MDQINEVSVRWTDGYLEEFEAVQVRAGVDLLWMVLKNGHNRHIPLRHVRWFSITPKASNMKSDKFQDGCGSVEPSPYHQLGDARKEYNKTGE